MKEYTINTAEDYDDLVGYISEDNLPNNNLAELLDIAEDYKITVKPKTVDKEFPEQWQDLYVNFNTIGEFAKFMTIVGEAAHPKLKEFIYSSDGSETNILNFM